MSREWRERRLESGGGGGRDELDVESVGRKVEWGVEWRVSGESGGVKEKEKGKRRKERREKR